MVMSLKINNNLKHNGDSILSQLVIHQGVLFKLNVTSDVRKSFDDMSIDERRSEIKLGHDDHVAERVRSANDIHTGARAKYGF